MAPKSDQATEAQHQRRHTRAKKAHNKSTTARAKTSQQSFALPKHGPISSSEAPAFYGNTQALVLRPSNANSAAITAMLERNDYRFDKRATCATANVALAPYRGFRKLIGERIHAKNYPNVRPNGSFMDLPGELRNRIYRLMLDMGSEVELAPKTTKARAYSRASASQVARVNRQHMKRKLGILRLSRAVNAEAADIFYGEQEFRFSNSHGWYVLHAFLHGVGSSNVARLRHIVVCVPWRGIDSDLDPPGLHEGISTWAPENSSDTRMLELTAMELPTKATQGLNFESCVTECFTLLEEAGSLETLHFILPRTYQLASPVLPLALNLSKFDNERFSIILVCMGKYHFGPDLEPLRHGIEVLIDGETEDGGDLTETFDDAEKLADALGGVFKETTVYFKGNYSLKPFAWKPYPAQTA